MSSHQKRHCIVLLYFIAFSAAKGQPTNRISANDGIWEDYGSPVSARLHSEFYGRLVNVNWSDIETSPNYWDWTAFDSDVSQHIAGNMPVIILVYTGPNAPNWLYSNGVPKVNATDSLGNVTAYSPYYLDSNYNSCFKRMITNVNQHIQNYPSSIRNLIIGIQGCYGSTGDQIAYKGTVPAQYQISSAQFDSLFKVYSLCYYNQYQALTPPITLLSNPSTSDSTETYWLVQNCPGGWLKCGTFAKGSQINMELDKQSWLYNILNQPQNSRFVMSRSEITGPQLSNGWWLEDHYKEMFGIMCYCIYWGLDWPNETGAFISDHHYDSAFSFFNKYAGQKIPGLATNAVCALKDALDASDSIRFPSGTYGTVSQSNSARFENILNAYSGYGAKLEDVSAATGYDLGCLSAKGTNDVGWHLLPGNYERYLHQINANATSAGYWNVDNKDSTIMFGRYARGFDIANNKNGLYFDVDDNFLRNVPLNGAYPVTVEVTYFDSGYGSWKLYYDAVGNSNQASVKVSCANTGKWKKCKIVLSQANFGNKSVNKSDFYIKNTGSQNVIFSVVEVSRAQLPDSGFITTNLNPFDTVCINSPFAPNSFVLHATSLNGTNVQIGPLKGCSFSTSATGKFSDTLFISSYGNTINQTIYVKLNTTSVVNIPGSIPITGGGQNTALVTVRGSVVNSSPTLNAVVSNVTCYGNKNGSIDLRPSGGIDSVAFAYKWTNDYQQFWNATTQDLSNLNPGNYTVVVSSVYGCSTSKVFPVRQPQPLQETVTRDSNIVCKGGSTTVTVSATGGTRPYTGTGTFVQASGFKSYAISDVNNCTDSQGISLVNGTLTAPLKPDGIQGPVSVAVNKTGITFSVINPNAAYTYKWTVSGGTVTGGQGTASITVTWGTLAGSVAVSAGNSCGSSSAYTLNVSILNGLTNNSDFAMSAATANTLSPGDAIALMPNPVKDIATVTFFTATSEAYTVEINDVNGKQLLIQKNTSLPGTNLKQLDVAGLSAGIYFITLTDKNGERRMLKMIKQ
jgi:hypothetical protein